MEKIKIGDKFYHPCSIDIMNHVVIGIREYENHIIYHLKATHNIGSCGKIEVLISENNGKFRFIELLDEDNIEHASGLQDFVEGYYYTNLLEAKLEFYKLQESIAITSLHNAERIYKQANERYNQVHLLVKNIKEDLKNLS